jgi:hypothetical protein
MKGLLCKSNSPFHHKSAMNNKFSILVSRICHSVGMPVCSSEEDMPPVDFDFCDPDVRLSEIKRVFFSVISGGEFEDWSDADEWNFRLSRTSSDRRAIRDITCIADKPQPTSIKKQLSADRRKTTSKTHTINVTIDESTPTNHAFIQSLKKGKKLRCWYETMGGRMFGGNAGIIATVFADMELSRGLGEIQIYQMQIIWNTLDLEDYIESPIFQDVPVVCDAITGLIITDIGTSTLTVSWDSNGATLYEYAYNITGDLPTSWHETTDTTVLLYDLTGGVEYFVFVRAKCTLDTSGDPSMASETTTPITCDIPTGLSAIELTATSWRVEFDAPVTPGQEYRYVINDTGIMPDLSFGTGTYLNADDMAVTFTGLLPLTHEYVWIRAKCSDSDYSIWVMVDFTTGPPALSITSGLVLWDNSIYGVQSLGTSLLGLTDQSGYDNHLSKVDEGAGDALIVDNVFGAYPGIVFNENNALETSGNFIGLDGVDALEVWTVLDIPAGVPSAPLNATFLDYSSGNISSDVDGWTTRMTFRNTSSRIYSGLYGDVGVNQTALIDGALLSSRRIVRFRFYKNNVASSECRISVTGLTTAISGPNNNTNTFGLHPLRMGHTADGFPRLKVTWGATAIYNRALTDPEAATVESELAAMFSV